MKLRHKIETPHRDGCAALKAVKRGDWFTPWGPPADGAEAFTFRDSLGRRRGSRAFLRLICNSTDCPGRILVRMDDVWALLPHGRAVSARRPTLEATEVKP